MGEIAQREAPITQQETRRRGLEEREMRRYDEGRDRGPGERGGVRVRACVREEREGRQTGNESEKDEGLSRQNTPTIAAELPMLYLPQRANKMGQPQSTRLSLLSSRSLRSGK